MCSQNAGNAISETQILKCPGDMPKDPSRLHITLDYVIIQLTPIGAFQ
jgi:hypothetical protein